LFNGGGVYQNISIHGNLFEMSDTATAPCLNNGQAMITTRIYRNIFIQKDTAAPYFLRGANAKAHLEKNVVRSKRKDS
jgi:hypothetical protein